MRKRCGISAALALPACSFTPRRALLRKYEETSAQLARERNMSNGQDDRRIIDALELICCRLNLGPAPWLTKVSILYSCKDDGVLDSHPAPLKAVHSPRDQPPPYPDGCAFRF